MSIIGNFGSETPSFYDGFALECGWSLTHPDDGDIKPNTKDCQTGNGEEKSADWDKRIGQWEPSNP
jgi:hypothetical protein